MKEYDEYFKNNKSLWDEKTSIHAESKFYDVDSFLKTGNSLNKIEEELLGDVKGKTLIHLQCHFGMDSISLAKKGAIVTAIDLSTKSIELADKLNTEMGTSVDFIESNVYDTLNHVPEGFDIVFTSYGALCWLPDLHKWAEIVAHLLKPGGKLVLVEFHPAFYIFDFPNNRVGYDYFNTSVYKELNEGSYAAKDSELTHVEYFWNHALSEVINPLLSLGLKLEIFREYDYSPYDCFDNLEKRTKNEYVYRGVDVSIPHIYSIVMSK